MGDEIPSSIDPLQGARRPPGTPERPTSSATPSRQPEPELGVRLLVVHLVGRISRSRDGRHVGRYSNVPENPHHRLPLRDYRQHPQQPAALRVLEDVDLERSPQEPRPVDARRARVARPPEQPLPLPNRDHVRREERGIAAVVDGLRAARAGRDCREASVGRARAFTLRARTRNRLRCVLRAGSRSRSRSRSRSGSGSGSGSGSRSGRRAP
jgi:uncharacterized membrane protein YgcG